MRDWIRRPLGRVMGYGVVYHKKCQRCHVPWAATTSSGMHITQYNSTFGIHGIFPLCELCWERLSPEQRWPFYQKTLVSWRRDAKDERELMRIDEDERSIRNAVSRGL
jgi:hypothetical protein